MTINNGLSGNNLDLASVHDSSSFEPEALFSPEKMLASLPGEHPRMAAGLAIGREASQTGHLDVAELSKIASELYAEGFPAGAFGKKQDEIPSTASLSDAREPTGTRQSQPNLSDFSSFAPSFASPKDLVVQVFQRRLLTYTASNPDPFRVEFGNIGKHYYQWRYEFANNPSGSQITIGKPPADSVQKSGSLTVNILAVTPMVQRGQGATLVATVMSGAQCMLQLTYQSGPATDVLLPGPRSADSGSIAWIWRVTQTTVPGPATAVVSCTSDGQSGTATTTFMITS